MEKGPDALGTAKNESGSPKRKNETRHPWLLSKTGSGAENMKTGPDALGTTENEFGSAKHEDETRRPRYRRKRVRVCQTLKRDPKPPELPNTSLSAQNKKTGPDALGSSENESGHAKHENGTRRPRYHRKRV
jgi:hypothetical protein